MIFTNKSLNHHKRHKNVVVVRNTFGSGNLRGMCVFFHILVILIMFKSMLR